MKSLNFQKFKPYNSTRYIRIITGAEALIEAITAKKSQAKISARNLQEIHTSNKFSIAS